MRYVKIFLLHFQYVFERRSVSVVWFLVSFTNPLILLLYWRGALQNNDVYGWSLSSISTYYFILVIAAAMLMSHIEENVSEQDIEEGHLVKYLIRPFPYYWFNFIREIPYRLLQGSFGVFSCLLFIVLFGNFISITTNIQIFALSILVFVLAYFLSFTYKMFLGLTAFWFIDAGGFYQLMEVLMILFAGYILPINLMPEYLSSIANLLPFAYIIYYPVITLQGKLNIGSIIQVIFAQIVWIGIFAVSYKILWSKGIKKFTGVGQ